MRYNYLVNVPSLGKNENGLALRPTPRAASAAGPSAGWRVLPQGRRSGEAKGAQNGSPAPGGAARALLDKPGSKPPVTN